MSARRPSFRPCGENSTVRTRKPQAIVPRPLPPERLLPPSAGVLAQRPDLVEAARDYVKASRAKNTTDAYGSAERHFAAWCLRHQVAAWPATVETVFSYFTDCAASGAAWNTIMVRRAAIAVKHRHLGFEQSPTKHHRVKTLLEGIRRTSKPAHGRAPLTWDALPAVLKAIETWQPLEAARARAVLLLGVASALRREQIAGLMLEDVKRYPRGLVLHIHREKTDQLGKGRIVRIPIIGGPACAVTALDAWLKLAGITSGPVFRALSRGAHVRAVALDPGSVWQIVKDAVGVAGLDPTDFGAHSLRAGFVTAARARGVDWGTIMQQTGHRRMETVLKYDRPKEDDANAWDQIAGAITPTEKENAP